MANDPYSVLGVGKTAGEEEIRRAYRKLAKENHPDRKPGDKAAEERFKQASNAFSFLSDAERRAKYDRGEIDADGAPRAPYGFRPGGPGSGPGPGAPPPEFEEFFADFFGAGAGPFGPRGGGRGGARGFRQGPAPGADVRAVLHVSFVEAATGARTRVDFGGGRTLDIAIPAGAETGQILRLKGQGEPGDPPGDALVELNVRPHAHFRRVGDDIHLDFPISLKEAVLGGKVQAPTPTGLVALNVPPGSNTGATLRLRGRGVQRKGAPGDLLVRLLVTLPDGPDGELQRFVADWSRADASPNRPRAV